MPQLLTAENYAMGFLIDEELMGGVSPHPEQPQQFIAFVLRHTTGEYLGAQPFAELQPALDAINRVNRNWVFEKTGGCASGGACGCGTTEGSDGKKTAGCGGCGGSLCGTPGKKQS